MGKKVEIEVSDAGDVYVDTSADPGEWPDCPSCDNSNIVRPHDGDDEDVYCLNCGQSLWLDIKIVGFSYLPDEKHRKFKQMFKEA